MSKEEKSDLTKSWVFVDSEKKSSEDQTLQTSGAEDLSENDNHVDSDTDSISVISESGCSYKTDEEEFVPATTTSESNESIIEAETTPEITEAKPLETAETSKLLNENNKTEKLLYFATSAACALILIGFSIVVQHYFYGNSSVNKFTSDFDQQNNLPVSTYIQSVKNQDVQVDNHMKKSYNFKRKSQSIFGGTQNKAVKREKDDFHDKIIPPSTQIENNDLTIEDVKSNYKLGKNKCPATKFNKENCDDTDKPAKNNEFKKQIKTDEFNEDAKKNKKLEKIHKDIKKTPNDKTYNKKMKALKIKEDYLNEKEKFLIEKEHDLMKKEIKLNKEKQNYGKSNYETKTHYKKEKERKYSSEDHNNKKKKENFNAQKKYFDEESNLKYNKKYKSKEEKKRYHDQYQHKIIDDSKHRRRNISGQWYIELHKARNNIRQKEHASDWVFDRAHLRSLKRNKAHWYFQWMVDRARLRVK